MTNSFGKGSFWESQQRLEAYVDSQKFSSKKNKTVFHENMFSSLDLPNNRFMLYLSFEKEKVKNFVCWKALNHAPVFREMKQLPRRTKFTRSQSWYES